MLELLNLILTAGTTFLCFHVLRLIREHEKKPERQDQSLQEKQDTAHPRPFRYTSLHEGQIRILVLEPGRWRDPVRVRLEIEELAERPEYEAISYSWGNAQQTKPITCDGGLFHITENLFDGLRRMRLADRERYLWADAICINQDDVDERERQVGLMGAVYSTARQVLVWMGEEARHEGQRAFEAMDKMDRLASFYCPVYELEMRMASGIDANWAKLQPAISQVNVGPIRELTKKDWFRRSWVVQEIIRARKATLICGGHHFAWDKFSNVWTLLSAYTGMNQGNITLRYMLDAQEASDRYWEPLDWIMDMTALIWMQSSFECKDPRDKIYAVLNLTESEGLKADYRISEKDLVMRFIKWSLFEYVEPSLRFLSLAGISYQSKDADLPSWFHELGQNLPPGIYINRVGFNATLIGDTREARLQAMKYVRLGEGRDSSTLHVRGMVVDAVGPDINITETAGTINAKDARVEFLELQRVLLECQALLRRTVPENVLTDMTDFTKLAHFVCALCTDYSDVVARTGPQLPAESSPLRSMVATLVQEPDSAWLLDFVVLNKLLNIVSDNRVGRRFGLTAADRYAWFPRAVRHGDRIALFEGSRVPYVVREVVGDAEEEDMGGEQEGGGGSPCRSFELVGECFVQGIMAGAMVAMTPKHVEPPWVHMRLV